MRQRTWRVFPLPFPFLGLQPRQRCNPGGNLLRQFDELHFLFGKVRGLFVFEKGNELIVV